MSSSRSPKGNSLLGLSSSNIGLLLIGVAVLSWGTLPIALKLSTPFIDPVTLTWFRFLFALVVSFLMQWFFKQLGQFKGLSAKDWGLLLLGAIFSALNYITFVYSLEHLSPGQAQLNFQTAPFFLAFGGILFFKERLTAIQMTGFATLALGMMLFFHPYLNLSDTISDDRAQLWLGVLIIQFSALSWTSYALIQKKLVKQISPNNILLFIYSFGVIVMFPLCDFSTASNYSNDQWTIIVYAAINTLLAYGCFAQSMKFLSTAQTGAMLSLTPLLSLVATNWAAKVPSWQHIIVPAPIDRLSGLGLMLVIFAVIAIQVLPELQKRKRQKLSIEQA